MGLIYCLTSPINKKYIGKTTQTLELKWKEHIDSCRKEYKGNNKVLNKALKKYGDKHFKIEILEECDNEYLDLKELEYIKKYDTIIPKGMNIVDKIEKNEEKIEISEEDLSKYLLKIEDGYKIYNHNMGPDKKFISKKTSDNKKYKRAIKYLNKLNNLKEPIIVEKDKYIIKKRNGYCVKYPNNKTKYFISKTLSANILYEDAQKYLNELKIKECS